MEKKIVHYVPNEATYIEVGKRAVVYPTDHTSDLVDNGRVCYTSRVLNKQEDGTFETLNSIYKPVQD